MQFSKRSTVNAVLASFLVFAGVAHAHGDKPHAKPAGPVKMEQKAWPNLKTIHLILPFAISKCQRWMAWRFYKKQKKKE